MKNTLFINIALTAPTEIKQILLGHLKGHFTVQYLGGAFTITSNKQA
jgi:hypothetical protein